MPDSTGLDCKPIPKLRSQVRKAPTVVREPLSTQHLKSKSLAFVPLTPDFVDPKRRYAKLTKAKSGTRPAATRFLLSSIA
eukprot:214129-Pleurochrysis_carterae.AAC.1